MTTFLLYETSTGRALSIGTVVTDPLPPDRTSLALTPTEANGFQAGSHRWNASARAVEPTPGWIDPTIADGNRTTIEQQAATALAANRTFTAIASPTAAQNAAQIKALTRQNNGIIRLLLGQLDAID